MSKPDTGGDGTSLEAKDEDGLVQRERLKDIIEARRQIAETTHRIEAERLAGQMSQLIGRTLLRRAVGEYVAQVRTLLTDDEIEDAADYWQGYELGRWQLPKNHVINTDFPGLQQQGQTAVAFGVQTIVKAPDPIPVLEQEHVYDPIDGHQTKTEATKLQLPRSVSLEARYAVDEFLKSLGIGVKLEEMEDGDAGFTHDILDDGPPPEDITERDPE